MNWDKLIEVIGDVIKSIQSAAETQLPDIARQLIAYEMIGASYWVYFWAVFAGIAFIIFCIGLFISIKDTVSSDATGFMITFFLLTLLFAGISMHHNVYRKQCEMAPKIIVIQKLTEIIKK